MSYIEIKKFSDILKSNDIEKITKFIVTKNPELDTRSKVDTIVNNVCSLKIKTLNFLIELMRIKYTHGKLYIKSVECNPEVFGFIQAYYSINEENKYKAYKKAMVLGRIDILRKIRGISSNNLERLRGYALTKEGLSEKVVDYVRLDSKKARSKKDKSPEDILNKKLGKKAKKSKNRKEKINSIEDLTSRISSLKIKKSGFKLVN